MNHLINIILLYSIVIWQMGEVFNKDEITQSKIIFVTEICLNTVGSGCIAAYRSGSPHELGQAGQNLGFE